MSNPEKPDFERELSVYAFMLGYGQTMLEGIDDKRMCEQPLPGINHPTWQIGHLTVVAQRIMHRIEQGPEPDPAWQKLFGPGSAPSCEVANYPSKDELVRAWVEQHAKVERAVRAATPEVLARPNPVERMRPALPTMSHLVTMLLTSHESMHLGQLAMWRRLIGIPAMF